MTDLTAPTCLDVVSTTPTSNRLAGQSFSTPSLPPPDFFNGLPAGRLTVIIRGNR